MGLVWLYLIWVPLLGFDLESLLFFFFLESLLFGEAVSRKAYYTLGLACWASFEIIFLCSIFF
jgi:hypothetical protein